MGWVVLPVVRDWSADPPGGSGRVGGPSWRSGSVPTNPFKGPGRVGGASWGSGMGLEVFRKVWDGSGDPPGGSERVRGTLVKVQNWSGGTSEGPGWVGGPSRRFGTVRGTLPEVWDGSEYPFGGPGRVGGPS